MSKKLSEIFKNIPVVEPSEKLESLILSRIKFVKLAQEKRKMWFSSLGLVFSGISIVFSVMFLGKNIIGSEFWKLISLVFSDGLVVVGYWNAYLYSLLETLPVVSFILILLPIAGLLISLGFYLNLKNKNKNIYCNHFKLA